MSRVILKRPAVLVDLETIAAHIGRDRPKTALRFLNAAEKAFRLLSEFPTFGSSHPMLPPDLADVLCFPIRRFRTVVIFYRPIKEGIEVIRVLHGARNVA